MPALAASNPRIRRLRRLSGRRSARLDERAFLLEGPVLVAEALAAFVPLDGIYGTGAALTSELVATAHAQGIAVHEVADGVLDGITDAVTPRPVLAVAPLVAHPLGEVVDRALAVARPLLVLVDVRDPGNLGTILRAAEASGAAGVVCTKGTVDPWSPKAVRSSAGAVLHVPVVSGPDAADVLAALARAGIPRIGTVVHGGVAHDRSPLTGPIAIVLGGEAHGLGADLARLVDQPVTIPMEGRAESLNVAMAASILCFEALRQRGVAGRETVPLPAEPIGRPDPPATR